MENAVSRLRDGLWKMLECKPEILYGDPMKNVPAMSGKEILDREEYCISLRKDSLSIEAESGAGVLYGVFDLLRTIACEKDITAAYGSAKRVRPSNPLRMLNHWDNMDGSIERGYSGESFLFQKDEIIIDQRTEDYAALMAAVGINGIVINNVNVKGAASYLITDRYYEKLSRLGEIFAGYGIRLFVCLNFAAPIEVGGLDSADPLDPKVIGWWKETLAKLHEKVPTLAGFLVKADSEGRPGPFTYGRTQADGANMLADIEKEYGGIIIWRCFVYNCRQDWRDTKTDRAKAGYDSFMPMDGTYHDNVILQIKNGPMDFQVREPISPLLGGLQHTNQMLEVQLAQEYTGQQIDLCYLIPEFREILDFKTYCREKNDTVADIISGKTFGDRYCGIAAVTNTGCDFNWTGSYLAGANLYGFGRLAFDTTLTPEQIAEEFVRMTISCEDDVVRQIVEILLPSWSTYEKYTSPLGIGWMVRPNVHYGCSVDGYEYDKWGTYHRADHKAIGVDRSDKGTGYAQQYQAPNAQMYNSPETCPDELVLFFHRLPYTHRLHSGKTVIQHIYDTHFEGYEEVEQMSEKWDQLEGRIDDDIFENVKERFTRQLENAREWRDQVNSYFYRKSGICDEKGREIY
ncbi:MAG: alpha-glucuronidase [Lachnospiraceae bacterium]|nr:alpha-glucuronidase [Lachnospiraceae bacterium]